MIARSAAKLGSSCLHAIGGRFFPYIFRVIFYSLQLCLHREYFCGFSCSSCTLLFSPGVVHARAISRPGSCVLYSLALSACFGVGGGGIGSTITTCARGENGLNSFNPGRTVPYLHCRHSTGVASVVSCLRNRTDLLLTTLPSLHACGRQAGDN